MSTPIVARDDSEQCGNEAVQDDVNHPAHYQSENGLEVIEVIESFNPDPVAYMLGNVTKYTSRGGKKPGNSQLKDLKKARWYLDRAIQYIEKHDDK